MRACMAIMLVVLGSAALANAAEFQGSGAHSTGRGVSLASFFGSKPSRSSSRKLLGNNDMLLTADINGQATLTGSIGAAAQQQQQQVGASQYVVKGTGGGASVARHDSGPDSWQFWGGGGGGNIWQQPGWNGGSNPWNRGGWGWN